MEATSSFLFVGSIFVSLQCLCEPLSNTITSLFCLFFLFLLLDFSDDDDDEDDDE